MPPAAKPQTRVGEAHVEASLAAVQGGKPETGFLACFCSYAPLKSRYTNTVDRPGGLSYDFRMDSIDLNCDMGEGCGNDSELMNYVSSANIACGFHAGDAETMRKTVDSAMQKGVAIGAHPSFPGREGFGRHRMDLPPDEIYEIVAAQICTLRKVCEAAGAPLRHVKPHGALYNQAAKDTGLANAIARAVTSVDEKLILYGLAGSALISEAAKCGLKTASEGFADRTYRSDGCLTPRSEANALIHAPEAAIRQVFEMVAKQTVTSADSTTIPIAVDTICIHGDGENAVKLAKTIYDKLIENGVEIRAL